MDDSGALLSHVVGLPVMLLTRPSPVVVILAMLITLLASVVEVLVILARLPAVDRALAGVRATSPVVHHTRRAADRGGAIKGYNSPSLFYEPKLYQEGNFVGHPAVAALYESMI